MPNGMSVGGLLGPASLRSPDRVAGSPTASPERHYVHVVPGRVRVRSCRLRDRATLARAERLVRSIRGVELVHARPKTGSLLIHHDPAGVDGAAVVRVLADARLVDPEAAAASGGRLEELAHYGARHAYEAATSHLLPHAAAALLALL